MKKEKKLKGAEAVGVKMKVSKDLDKLPRKILFPEKLAKANEVIAKLKIK